MAYLMPEPTNPPGSYGPNLDNPGDPIAAQRKNLLDCCISYLAEGRDYAREWQLKAMKSWDMLHGRINWQHKRPEQSKIHMNRVGLAQEQIKAQIKQGLVNFDKWLTVENAPGFESQLMTTDEARRLVIRMISDTDPRSKISDNLGIAAVENMFATKLQPVVEEKTYPGGKKYKYVRVEHIPLNIFNFYPDGKGTNLYNIHEVEMDKHQILALASENPDKQKPYRLEVAKRAQPAHRIEELRESQTKGNDILPYRMSRRQTCVLHEIWGTFLDSKGEVIMWKKDDGSEMPLKNVVVTMINESEILADPAPYPTWDNEDYFIVTQLLRSHINFYGRSLLAPGVDLNRAEDELINSCVDAGLKEGANINVVKLHGVANKEQLSGGIKYGTTLIQNEMLAPGEQLIDTVRTGQVSQGVLTVLNMIQAAGAENMRLNNIALSGQLPGKQVKATEVASAGQTIQGLFESIVGDLEEIYIEDYAKKVFLIGLQFASLLDDQDLQYVFFGYEQRIEAFKVAIKKPKQLYDELACAFRFRGKGIRSLQQSYQTAQALTNLFGMIASNPIVGEMFQRRGLDMTRLFDKVLSGFKVDIEELLDPATAQFATTRQLIQEAALAHAQNMEQAPQQGQSEAVQQNALNQGPAQPGLVPGNMAGMGQLPTS